MAQTRRIVALLALLVPGCGLFLLEHRYSIEGDATATDGQQSWGVYVIGGTSAGETDLDQLHALDLGLSPDAGWEDSRLLPYVSVEFAFSEPVGALGTHAVTVVGGTICPDWKDSASCVDLLQAGWSGSGSFTTLDYRRLDNPDPDSADPEHPKVPDQEGSATLDLSLVGPGGRRLTISGGSLTLTGVKYYPELG